MELVRRPHAANLVRWAKDRPEVIVLSGDLTGSTEIAEFGQAFPERFFSMGMAEQNMLSWAGGLAREGFTPFLHTFAVFLYRRPYDQLAMSVAYPNLRVRLFAFLPGLTTPGGVTHQAIEDVALMRTLPNMTVLEMGDATDVESVLDVAQAVDGPVYVRMLRGEVPRLFPRSEPLRLNQARVLAEGDDLTVISSGIMTETALRTVTALRGRGLGVHHLHVSTLKPFDDPAVVEAVRRPRHGVITMENHTVVGGLGSAVAEVMAEQGVGRRLVRMGLPDTFAHGSSLPYLLRTFGLTGMDLVRRAEELTGSVYGIDETMLAAIRLDRAATVGQGQLEAL
jgi:transketolase